MRGKLSEAQIERVLALREKGWSCRSIARELGVSSGAINYQCLRNGAISPKQRGRQDYSGPSSWVGKDGRTFRRFTDDDDRRMLRLANAGLKIHEIAAQMDRANTSIRMRMLLLGAHEDIAQQRREAV